MMAYFKAYLVDFVKDLCIALLVFVGFIAFVGFMCRLAEGAELDLGLNLLSGQHQTRSLDLGVKASVVDKLVTVSSRVRYGKHDSEIVQNQGYLRLGLDPELSESWSLWFYEQFGYDKPKQIEFENFAGGGPKYTFYETDASKSSISFGYLYHYQEFETSSKKVNRLSWRVKTKHDNVYVFPWVGGFHIDGIVFYQPSVEDFDDYLVDAEIGLSVNMYKGMKLKLLLEDHYRSMSLVAEKNEFLAGLHVIVGF